MSAGYIYVLINPSMPGLAKVGKTARDPDERARELSSSTGVPSPFMVAFQAHVADCHAAEREVHEELEGKGWRSAKNREFFNGPVHEILAAVVRIARTWEEADASDRVDLEADDEDELAENLYSRGLDLLDHYDKTGSVDALKESLNCLERASDLGKFQALELLALKLCLGPEPVRDVEKGLGHLSAAICSGHWEAANYSTLVLARLGRKQEAVQVWIDAFRRAAAGEAPDGYQYLDRGVERYQELHMQRMLQYFDQLRRQEIESTPAVPDQYLAALSEVLLGALAEQQRFVEEHPQNFSSEDFQDANFAGEMIRAALSRQGNSA